MLPTKCPPRASIPPLLPQFGACPVPSDASPPTRRGEEGLLRPSVVSLSSPVLTIRRQGAKHRRTKLLAAAPQSRRHAPSLPTLCGLSFPFLVAPLAKLCPALWPFILSPPSPPGAHALLLCVVRLSAPSNLHVATSPLEVGSHQSLPSRRLPPVPPPTHTHTRNTKQLSLRRSQTPGPLPPLPFSSLSFSGGEKGATNGP